MILCAGQALIDCIVTESGSGDVADDIALCPGGEAFNEAVTLARLGQSPELLAAVGEDQAGDLLRSLLAEAGVPLRTNGYGGRTPVALLTVDGAGGRKSRVSRVHELAGFSPALPAEGAAPAFVTMASLFRPPFREPAVCAAFSAAAKAAGAVLLADTKLPKGREIRLENYAACLAKLDYITPNEAEMAYYTGQTRPEAAAEVFHSFGVKTVIIKLAEKGCYVSPQGGGAFYRPAFPVRVADGIGAGDAFAAGLLCRLAEGAALDQAVDFATACGAICATERGAVGAIRSKKQVEDFLAARETGIYP